MFFCHVRYGTGRTLPEEKWKIKKENEFTATEFYFRLNQRHDIGTFFRTEPTVHTHTHTHPLITGTQKKWQTQPKSKL